MDGDHPVGGAHHEQIVDIVVAGAFVDARDLAAAGRLIYMENQYLISAAIGAALAQRLREPNGPEVVIVISQASGGWLQNATMDVLRARLVKRLCEADHHRRLRVYSPVIDG